MSSITDVQGIKFYNNRDRCLSNYNKTSCATYAWQVIQELGNTLTYFGIKLKQRCEQSRAVLDHTTAPEGGFTKQKLVICLHGRDSHPLQFARIASEMMKMGALDMDLYIPHILEKGKAAKLNDMVEPIFMEIQRWAKIHHDKELELTLIGISNGGRIARAIDAKLGAEFKNIRRLRFVSIVGACKGTMMANIALTLSLGSFVGKDIREELPVGSKRNLELDEKWTESLAATPSRKRDYVCIASANDWYVPNFSSTLLEIPDKKANVQYAIVPGHGHTSIVYASAKAVASVITGHPFDAEK